jgi:hypothetical protein
MQTKRTLTFTLQELEEALIPWAATPAHRVFIHHAISGWRKELDGQNQREVLEDIILLAISVASKSLPAHQVLDYSPVSA